MATAHAKNYPPSAAKRWLSCPFSATVAAMYDRDETDASLKGDTWHKAMEDMIAFGTLPLDCDPDMAEAMQHLYDEVVRIFKAAGPGAKIFVERRIDIPETGEFGTGDIVIVSPSLIAVIDHKSGYVPVDVWYNAQMMTYLLGLIAEFGERSRYVLAIHQPNYDHIKGPFREYEPTADAVAAFRLEVEHAVARPHRVKAGPHCKATYCEHRGACEPFRAYAMHDLSLGWHTSELKGMADADLSKALDASDELNGWRAELRAEAMRRIMNMDRKIEGYKVVKGRRNRAVHDAKGLILSARDQLGEEWAVRMFDPSMAWASGTFLASLADPPEVLLKHLGTPKHIEDVIKQYARVHHLPRGAWEKIYKNVVGEYIRELNGGLTLERAIDGRPAHRRGSEFGVLDPANGLNAQNAQNAPIVL